MDEKFVVLIPAYEPEDKLIDTVRGLKAAGTDIVVVDDGSGADFAQVFSAVSDIAAVVHYGENRGKGTALKTGLQYIRLHYSENCVVVTADADGQHTAGDILRAAHLAQENPGCLILGARSFGRGTPLRSRLGNKITCAVFRASSGQKVSDTQTGLRAFTSDLIPFLLGIEGERYEYEMNMLLRCAKENIKMIETPIATLYFDNNSGSHFRPMKDSFIIYKEIFKFAASSFTGFLVDYGMYSLLVTVTAGLGAVSVPLSNVCARVISASVNFTINRRVVFKHNGNLLREAAMYFLLAAGILTFNTLLLTALVEGLGWNKYLVKILTEVIFFTVSYIVQKYVIFRKKSDQVSSSAA